MNFYCKQTASIMAQGALAIDIHYSTRETEKTSKREAAMNKKVVGTLVFVGALIAINALSYLLDWPFWIY